MVLFPKPAKGSGAAARRARKKKLDVHRKKVNLQVLERDGHVCRRAGCGAPAVHAHHVFSRSGNIDSWMEKSESRLSLCADCHRKFHHTAEISKEELIIDLKRALTR